MTNLIEERNERTKARKKRKRKYDSIIGLSKDGEKRFITLSDTAKLSDGSIRLLDEGFCDSGFILKKGTLEKFLNGKNEYVRGWELTDEGWERTEVLNLTDDFVGTVNLGHMEFATFPFIVGEWTKKDLSLVDIENNRKALNVDPRLDEESVFVRELARQPYDIGISAEFYYHINDEDTEAMAEVMGAPFPVVDEIFIFAYGLVGECGNVNSSGLELKGEPMKDKELEKIIETEELEDKEELGVEEIDITEVEEELAEEETVEETAAEEAETEADEAEEEEAEEEESEEDAEGEEDSIEEAEDGDEDDDEEAENDSEELSIVENLKGRIQTLENTIAELTEANSKLKKTNRKLTSKYQNELDKKEKFKEQLKGMTVELLPDEDKKPTEEKKNAVDKNYIRSGIGEI